MRNYVEHVWPHLERGGGTPDEPMQAAKGSSNPPVSPWVLALMESNAVATRYIGWALGMVEEEDWYSSDGVPYSALLTIIEEDPGALERWRDPAAYYSRDLARAFDQMVRKVAKGVMFVHGRTDKERANLERLMNLSPDDPDALVVRRHPLEEEERRGRTRRGQVIDTMHTRRLMVEQLEQLEASTDYRGLAAMEVLSERKAKEGKDWSVRKIRRAVECVNRERRGEEGEVA